MENKKHCRHVFEEKCVHPELGGEVIGHRVWHCTICEYFTPRKPKSALVVKKKPRAATPKRGKRRR